MNTRLEIAMPGIEKEKFEELTNSIYRNVLLIENQVSRFKPKSQISALNRGGNSSISSLNAHLAFMLMESQRFYEASQGFFNILMPRTTGLPPANFFFDEDEDEISFDHQNYFLDLGGIAKGYSIDRIVSFLVDQKIQNALINFGNSSIFAMGQNPQGTEWKIAIESSTDNFFDVKNQALTTSSTFQMQDSKKKHHLVNKDGIVNTSNRSVSLLTKTAIEGEFLAKLLLLIPSSELESWLIKFNIKKYIFF